MEKVYHIGVDLHKKSSQVVSMDKEGNIVDMRKIDNDRVLLKEYFSLYPENTSVVVEATSGWEWLSDLLEEEGLTVKLANPHKVKLIAEATIKTDKIDATTLAQLDRTNYLPVSYLPPKEIREWREILRHRSALVTIRSSLKNRVHSILTKRGIASSFSDLFGKQGQEFLRGLKVPSVYRKEIRTYLALINKLDGHITELAKEIKKKVTTENPQAKLLTSIPGISYLSALLLMAEIGTIERFLSYKKLCSYAGLVPTTDQSAGKLHYGHLKKDSNKYIRWVLIEAVEHAIKQDPGLASGYYRILRKRGKNKARVAVARKLLISIYYMLKNNEPYKARKEGIQEFRANPSIGLVTKK